MANYQRKFVLTLQERILPLSISPSNFLVGQNPLSTNEMKSQRTLERFNSNLIPVSKTSVT